MQNRPASHKSIPTYSLKEFRHAESPNRQFQVEVFDANRHFKVSYPHKHDFYEVLFLTHGSGYHIIDSNKYEIQPPCVFFLSPGQAHKVDLSKDIGGFIFLFTADFYLINQANKNKLLEFPFFFSIEQNNPPLFLQEQKDTAFITLLFERGITAMQGSGTTVQSILDLLLQTCYELYPVDQYQKLNARGHLLVKNLLQLIEENYQNNLSPSKYAQLLNISPNHLTQVVKQITGKTTAKLIQDKVILETKRLLLHSSLTVTEIADFMHFPDQSYFTKYFKKATQQTPVQFRNEQESMKST